MNYFLVYLTGHLILATPVPDMDACNNIQRGYQSYMESQGRGEMTQTECEKRESPPILGEARGTEL